MYIKQGDQYSLPIPLRLGGESVSASQVQKIELVICNKRHLYPGDMGFADGVINLSLTQQETFSYPVGTGEIDIRVVFTDGTIRGIPHKLRVAIVDATSEEVL